MAQGKKSSKPYLLMVLSDQGSAVRKMAVPAVLVRYFPALVAGLGLFCLLLLVLFFSYRKGYLENRQAQKDLLQMHAEMDQVDTHLLQLEQTLERISSFDAKLRIMTNLQDPERKLAMGPLVNPFEDREESDSPFLDVLPQLHIDQTPSYPDELVTKVHRLQEQGIRQERSLTELTDRFQNQNTMLAAAPAIWPVRGQVTSHFGQRISPFSGVRKFHAGIDIGASPGTPVYAPGDGNVVFVGKKEGYGHTLIISHGYGLVTCFAHNSEVLVRQGERVKRGTLVAHVGNTGRSTGPHLHYEVRVDGKPQNPFLFILN